MSAARRKIGREQRTAFRVPLSLPGQISVPAEGVILQCTVKDLAAGGAGLSYEELLPTEPELAGVRWRSDAFGTFHGVTIRGAGQTRGFRFVSGEATRNGLLKKLTRFIESGLIDLRHEKRKSLRSAGGDVLEACFPNGDTEQCRVIDISLEGVHLQTHNRPAIGDLVRIGRLYGRVLGHREQGIALKFVSLVTEPAAGDTSRKLPEAGMGPQVPPA